MKGRQVAALQLADDISQTRRLPPSTWRRCQERRSGVPGPTFEEAYAEAVADGMRILGDKVAAVVENYLEQKYSIQLGDTVNNPQALSDALNVAIDGGSRVVQRRILRVLHQKIGLAPPASMTVDFAEKIGEARRNYYPGGRHPDSK